MLITSPPLVFKLYLCFSLRKDGRAPNRPWQNTKLEPDEESILTGALAILSVARHDSNKNYNTNKKITKQ